MFFGFVILSFVMSILLLKIGLRISWIEGVELGIIVSMAYSLVATPIVIIDDIKKTKKKRDEKLKDDAIYWQRKDITPQKILARKTNYNISDFIQDFNTELELLYNKDNFPNMASYKDVTKKSIYFILLYFFAFKTNIEFICRELKITKEAIVPMLKIHRQEGQILEAIFSVNIDDNVKTLHPNDRLEALSAAMQFYHSQIRYFS